MLPISKKFEDKMKALLGSQFALYEQSLAQPAFRGLRVNRLKIETDEFLKIMPAALRPSPFSEDGFYVADDGVSKHAFHHAGLYYMQEPSASSAVTVLNPGPHDRVLDLCAAPGGKSTQIASALRGTGLLVANEFVAARANTLISNLERMGVVNAVAVNSDTGLIARRFPLYFDKVLVDAPCSGEGMFKKEPQALSQWSQQLVEACAQRQKEILHNGACCLREGGELVYSTCTYSLEENEEVVEDFLRDHPDFVLLPSGAAFGQPGFDREGKTRRIFPFHQGEGHFIAKFQRVGGGCNPGGGYAYAKEDCPPYRAWEAAYLKEPHPGVCQTVGDRVLLMPRGLPDLSGLHILRCGVLAGTVRGSRLEPAHSLCLSAAARWRQTVELGASSEELRGYLHGEALRVDESLRGYAAVLAQGYAVGFGKAVDGVLKNHYPKGLRTKVK